MSFINHFMLLVALALLGSSFCIQGAPAAQFPPCSWHSKKAPLADIDGSTRNVTLFKLSFLINQYSGFSFTFTTTYNNSTAEDIDGTPTLAFILVTSQQLPSPSPRCAVQSAELSLSFITQQFSTFPQQILPPHFCNPLPQPFQGPTTCPSEPYPYDSDQTHFTDEVSFTYDAATPALQVQASFYSDGLQTNNTFTLSTPDLANSTVSYNESITVFVGYITSGEATINGSVYITSGEATINGPTMISVTDDGTAKSNHRKVVVWVIVGVFMMGSLMVLLILLLLTKCHRRPSLVNSRPAGHVAPPSTSKAPISHHDLESSATPAMMRALPLSPPYNTHAFQNSGTTSWLKQPNAR